MLSIPVLLNATEVVAVARNLVSQPTVSTTPVRHPHRNKTPSLRPFRAAEGLRHESHHDVRTYRS